MSTAEKTYKKAIWRASSQQRQPTCLSAPFVCSLAAQAEGAFMWVFLRRPAA